LSCIVRLRDPEQGGWDNLVRCTRTAAGERGRRVGSAVGQLRTQWGSVTQGPIGIIVTVL